MRINLNMFVCLCEGVAETQILRAIDSGARDIEAIGQSCGAGTGCGACHETLATMLDDANDDKACGLPLRACNLAPARAG